MIPFECEIRFVYHFGMWDRKDGPNILGGFTLLTSISTDLKIARSAVLGTFEIMFVLSMGKHSVLNN